jgi:hypothetical protein
MISVDLYIDNVLLGSGSLSYIDESAWGLWSKTVDRCTYTDICIDESCYSSAIEFCYTDKVTDWLPGSQQVQLSVPVYIDSILAGEAQLTYTDTYGMNIIPLIAILLIAILVASKRRRG